jgi:hypothetical protein
VSRPEFGSVTPKQTRDEPSMMGGRYLKKRGEREISTSYFIHVFDLILLILPFLLLLGTKADD